MHTRSTSALIGPAAAERDRCARYIHVKRSKGDNIFVLLYGRPGIGKSTAARELALMAADGNEHGVEWVNGQNVLVDRVRGWMDANAYGSMFAEYQVVVIDEIDFSSHEARGLLRSFINDARKVCVIATSNEDPETLGEQINSRCKPREVLPPAAAEIAALLMDEYGITYEVAQECARKCGGNVRGAILDAEFIEA